ncbi:MAG: L-seryl-tRNA(Sec) selenium transferase [Chloroflexi bacterium ADurb.Bin325]|nr:MAG: L-seryl-tRNA(Sec) selenium transferase [Chloroflexi bacterium ADurb.Bin325]
MGDETRGDARRRLPGVDRLLGHPTLAGPLAEHGRELALDAVREVLAEARAAAADGRAAVPAADALAAAAAARLAALARGTLAAAINATGVIIHTNLGRAPLSDAARRAMDAVAAGYSNLEYDLAAGERGSRYIHADALLRRLTGAEAALVVNNNAGAVFLVLSALARGREVVISRGQLVEIGGGFRIPDVLRQSGAQLVEVGTTNRTHLRDYRDAIGPNTALLLRVHSSNFKQIGFTAEVALADMVALGREHGVPVVDDLGSGSLLDTARFGISPEPVVQESIAAGADLVTFSGDKLLGGPQAGLIVGRAALIASLRQHPLTRALRVDKSTLAALQATLLHYLRGEAETAIPVWRMLAAPLDALAARAGNYAAHLRAAGIPATVVAAASTVGGGSLPGETVPTRAVALTTDRPDALAAALRAGQPPVIARIADDRLLLDPRTVAPEEDAALLAAVVAAWR